MSEAGTVHIARRMCVVRLLPPRFITAARPPLLLSSGLDCFRGHVLSRHPTNRPTARLWRTIIVSLFVFVSSLCVLRREKLTGGEYWNNLLSAVSAVPALMSRCSQGIPVFL